MAIQTLQFNWYKCISCPDCSVAAVKVFNPTLLSATTTTNQVFWVDGSIKETVDLHQSCPTDPCIKITFEYDDAQLVTDQTLTCKDLADVICGSCVDYITEKLANL